MPSIDLTNRFRELFDTEPEPDRDIRAGMFDATVLSIQAQAMEHAMTYAFFYDYPNAMFAFENALIVVKLDITEDPAAHVRFHGEVPDQFTDEDFVEHLEHHVPSYQQS